MRHDDDALIVTSVTQKHVTRDEKGITGVHETHLIPEPEPSPEDFKAAVGFAYEKILDGVSGPEAAATDHEADLHLEISCPWRRVSTLQALQAAIKTRLERSSAYAALTRGRWVTVRLFVTHKASPASSGAPTAAALPVNAVAPKRITPTRRTPGFTNSPR